MSMGSVGKKLVSGALGAAAVAGGVVKHVAWYLSYRMGRDREGR